MSESVNLPALGESVTEGTVTRWLKKVGDRVDVDEPLLEVSTDKVDTEIPSPIAGVIEAILVAEDETVEVGTALVTIGDGTGTAPPAAEDSGSIASGAAPTSETADDASPNSAPADNAQIDDTPTGDDPASFRPEQASSEPVPSPSYWEPAENLPEPGSNEPVAMPSGPDTESGAEPIDADARHSASDTPDATPSAPDTSMDAEVPSTDAPAPDEDSEAHPPAPVDYVDPAPAEESRAADTAPPLDGAPDSMYLPPTAPAVVDPTPLADTGVGSASMPTMDAAATNSSEHGASSEPASSEPAQPEPAASEDGGGSDPHAGYVTPLVRKLANENGIDLASVPGTGVGGRIRKQDVILAMEAPAATADPLVGADETIDAGEAGVDLKVSALRGTTVPMSRLRRVIAERAVVSMQSSAQLTSVVEVDVTLVSRYRDSVKADFNEKTGVKLSFLPFFALAACEALAAYPIVNATIDGDNIVYPPHENISIAVDTERGLLTPVIRDAAGLSLAGFATQIADLAARTRENKLKPDELAGGTFTLTNTGSRGALFDTPIVFLPQSAILGTGIVSKKAVVISDGGGDAIAVRSMVYLALSYDHRIVDGADAARFLVAMKERLEAGDFTRDLGI